MAIRRLAEAAAPPGPVLETHGGTGWLASTVYAGRTGIGIELNQRKAAARARILPAWWSIVGDSASVLRSGALRWFAPAIIDVDPYGDPWPALEAAAAGVSVPPAVVLAVTDGLPRALQIRDYRVPSLRADIAAHGLDYVREYYEEICRRRIQRLFPAYTIDRWVYAESGKGRGLALYAARITQPAPEE